MLLTRIGIALASLLINAGAVADESNRISQYAMSDDSVSQWQLPGKLGEISGLALSADGRLFAVADETAVIFQIDYHEGRLTSSFAFGDPVIAGDFEGIAWLDGNIYLATSDGILYSAPQMADGEHVTPARVDTGLGKVCEIEGLAAAGDSLYFACKGAPKGGNRDYVQIIVWSIAARTRVDNIEVPSGPINDALRMKHFNPSGITVDRVTGNLIIIAARQKSLLELTADGNLVAARRLRMPDRHRQAEGIELTADGRLLIADEGGDRKARLAVYTPQKGGESR
jgi:uncharacterized protein YjiK